MKKSIHLTAAILLISQCISAQSTTFNANGSYTVPAGVTTVTVELWGAGGFNPSNNAGAGGGAYVKSKPLNVTPGSTISVTVGTGSSTHSGFGSLITAAGGNGQNGGAANTASNVLISYRGGNGGTGTTTGFTIAGGGGGAAGGPSGNGPDGQNSISSGAAGGNGAASGGGSGGNGGSTSTNGRQGIAPGGGRGGKGTVNSGNGRVVVTVCTETKPRIVGNHISIEDGDNTPSFTDSTDFGLVNYNGGTVSRKFTIQNTGSSLLTISGISFKGLNMDLFSIRGLSFPALLNAGTSVSFNVVFSPKSEGLQTTTLSINYNNCSNPLFEFALQGTGTCAAGGSAIVKFQDFLITDGHDTPSFSDSTDFGDIGFNGYSNYNNYTIENNGTSPIVVKSINISGANAANFKAENLTYPFSVPAGGHKNFRVTFTPISEGPKTAKVNIVVDNCSISEYDFTVQGNGICITDDNPEVEGNGILISDENSNPSPDDDTDFGNVGFNGFSLNRIFTIKNPGSKKPLTIIGITFTGAQRTLFTIQNISFPKSIPAGGTATFEVKFTPVAAGVADAMVNIATDNCGIGVYNFAVRGTGFCDPAGAPRVLGQNRAVIADGDNSPSLDDLTLIGNVGTGGFSGERSYIIQNTSPASLNVQSISITGTNAAEFGFANIALPLNIPGNGEVSFKVKLSPAGGGARTATVNINLATCNTALAQYSFAVSGTGVAPTAQGINASGNFSAPIGVSRVVVEAWGAGARGASANGGGGGAYVKSVSLAVSRQTPVAIQIGQGNQDAATARRTTFGSFITANGGNGKEGGAISSGPNVVVSYKGGQGSDLNPNLNVCQPGGGGGGAGSQGPGNNGAFVTGGTGGTGGGGNGGDGKFHYLGFCFGEKGADGQVPGGGGGGGEDYYTPGVSNGGNGRVIVNYVCPGGGTIGTSHTITYPPQLVPDFIQSFEGLEPTEANGLIYSWEKSTDQTNWSPAKNTANSLTYRVDKDSIQVKTFYRRKNNACGIVNYSNIIAISVVKEFSGAISGKVISKNGTGVSGITVYAQKVNPFEGSPVSWIDSAKTGTDGQYSIQNIYFGYDPLVNNSISTEFIVTPNKADHGFTPASLSKTLTHQIREIRDVNFTDTTVYSITGKIIQECVNCLTSSGTIATTTGTVDSVEIYRDGLLLSKSGYLDPPGEFGRYSLSVTDPKDYDVRPGFKNHRFSPEFKKVTVAENVSNVDFKDITTYTISGRLTAGCNDFIGTAVLEFTDVLPNDQNGNPRAPQFRKRVTTISPNGFYSIILPARKWQVRVISFTSTADVTAPDLLDFFEIKVPKDSLVRDITTGHATLNLVYNRPPTISVSGLNTVCTGAKAFVLFEQGKESTFKVKGFQGPVSKNCPATDSVLFINTNIQQDDENEVIELKTVKGLADVTLTGGLPNIIAPHFKVLNIVFTDGVGRTVQKNFDSLVVTGIKSNPGTFTTVTPELPFMVLHDPPGDNSYSFWETELSSESAMRFYAAAGGEATLWAEVKVGAEFNAGIGYEVVTDIWGSVRGSATIAGRANAATEFITTTTTNKRFETAGNDAVVGAQGDVFIGAALNLLYAVTNEVSFDPASCVVSVNKKLIFAQKGFATEYIYSEDHIKNTLLPTLRSFLTDPNISITEKFKHTQSILVWEQVLKNNEANKARAAFVQNVSFDGAAGPKTYSTTKAITNSNTLEFDLAVSAEVALEAGVEVNGIGGSAGVSIGVKMETGTSNTNTTLKSTTIGYTLDDDDNGDFYSVNIKTDPQYATPVFEMVGGNTSCPFEPGSQPRDEFQLIAPQPVKTDIDPNGEAEFTLKLSNLNPSENRVYNLSFVQSSNPNGAVVTIGGSPAINPVSYSIAPMSEVNLLVKVKRGASNIFSYEGLQFRATDPCDGSIEKTARISAFFTPTCSPIQLVQPENGWTVSQADNNMLPVLFKGYNIANTTSVTLEYQRVGSNSWVTGFTRTAAQLTNSPNGTLVNWNVADLADRGYNLRMKLNCPTGVLNSERSGGTIDRVAPFMIGNPEPTDDEFVRGDQIAITYNEVLDCGGVTPEDVQVKRLSNEQIIPANVGCNQNQIVIVPITDIGGWSGDSISVSLKNISDLYGNGKTTTDNWGFIVGKTVAATGARALNLSSTTLEGLLSPGKSVLSNTTQVYEDQGVPIRFIFELGAIAQNDMTINYTVSGNGIFQKDYNIDYSHPQNLATEFNGVTGRLTLRKGTKRVELSIIPIPNQQFEPNKNITITLAEGGDYLLGGNVTSTGIILNDDLPAIYIFTGTGNYNVPANWDKNTVPPSQILVGDEVIIDPPVGGECILNVPVTVMPGAKFEVKPGKVLRINNSLQLKKKL